MKSENAERWKVDGSILEQFAEEEKKIRRESEILDREMKEKLIAKEKELHAARAPRLKEEAELETMRSNFLAMMAKVEKEESDKIAAAGKTEADFLSGKIGADKYLRDGLTPKEQAKKAGEAARERLRGMVEKIREKALHIVDMEISELKIEQDVFFLSCYPGQNEVARLKAHIKALEARITTGMGGSPASRARLDYLKYLRTGLQEGNQWFELDEAAVRALLLDPEFPSKHIGRLEEIIREISGSGKTYRIIWSERGAPYVTFMEEGPKKKRETS